MRPLVINNDVRKDIERVKSYARTFKYNVHDIMRIVKGAANSPGDNSGHVLEIPVGFRVVYTIEQQPEAGWCHHFSVSTPDPGRAVNEFGLRMIVDEFGLKGRTYDHVFKEDIGPNQIAINVLIRETPDTEKNETKDPCRDVCS